MQTLCSFYPTVKNSSEPHPSHLCNGYPLTVQWQNESIGGSLCSALSIGTKGQHKQQAWGLEVLGQDLASPLDLIYSL